jgi:hypothetical protein
MGKHFAGRMGDRRELLERLAEGRPVEAELAALTARLRQEESASVALPDASFTPSDVKRITLVAPSVRRGSLPWLVAGAAVLALVGGVSFWALRGPAAEPKGNESVEVVVGMPSAAEVPPAPDSVAAPPDEGPETAVAPNDAAPEDDAELGNKPKRKTVVVKKPKLVSATGNSAAAKTAADEAVRLFVGGNLVEAEKRFKDALAADAQYAPAHRGLGLVYERAGKNAQAVKHLRTYLKLAPGAADAAAIRKRIAGLGG